MNRYFYKASTQEFVTHSGLSQESGDEYLAAGYVEYASPNDIPSPPARVPDYVSKLGLKYALGSDWSRVKSFIDADPGLTEDWSLANWIYRSSPLMNSMATQLGFTQAQVNVIFIAAEDSGI